MITAKDILDIIYGIVTERPLYKLSYPDDISDDQFVVINTLGAPSDSIQTVEVNVNCYVGDADINRGIPDLATLNTMSKGVIEDLHNYNDNVVNIELVMTAIYREESINCHFMNLRFRVLFISN